MIACRAAKAKKPKSVRRAAPRHARAGGRAANVALLRAEPQLAVPDEQIEPLAELIRLACVGVALWWADHPEVPRATVVEVVVGVLMNGLPLSA